MKKIKAANRRLETITWGLLLMLWGITALFSAIPASAGIIGSGLILLGLNAVRTRKGIPTRYTTTVLGILALVWGSLELTRSAFQLPFEITDETIIAILLIVLGGIVLERALQQSRHPGSQAQG